jgi:hypothetical protein
MSVSELVLTSVVGASTYGAAWLASKRAKKTDEQKVTIDAGKLELEGRRAEGEAYERAAGFNKEITDQLSAQLQLMSETLTQMRADLAAEKATSALLRGELSEQQEKNAQQSAHIAQLEAQIKAMQSLIDDAATPEQ